MGQTSIPKFRVITRGILLFILTVLSVGSAYAYDIEDTLNQGETKTYTNGNREYVLTADFISNDFVVIMLNGERSGKLIRREEGDFRDGTTIVIREILYQSFAGGKKRVDVGLFLGSGRLLAKNSTQPTKPADETKENEMVNTAAQEKAPRQAQAIPSKDATQSKSISVWQRLIEFLKSLFV